MKKTIAGSLGIASAFIGLTYAACVDYSDPSKAGPDGDAPLPVIATTHDSGPPPSGSGLSGIDAASACGTRSFRGGTPNTVACPGVPQCECAEDAVCCMQRVDSNAGACTPLTACRDLALQCDGPEDCDGGICCLEDRSGGGASCKGPSSCGGGQWLCRGDGDCNGAPAGPHCTPLSIGNPGSDDVGLDGIIGLCGK